MSLLLYLVALRNIPNKTRLTPNKILIPVQQISQCKYDKSNTILQNIQKATKA